MECSDWRSVRHPAEFGKQLKMHFLTLVFNVRWLRFGILFLWTTAIEPMFILQQRNKSAYDVNDDDDDDNDECEETYLSSFVWQLRAVESRVKMSSSLPYGKLRPSDDVTSTRPYWPGFTHSADVLHTYTHTHNLCFCTVGLHTFWCRLNRDSDKLCSVSL